MVKRSSIYCIAVLALWCKVPEARAGLDSMIEKISLNEKGDEWRDHLWSSAFLTLSDAFLLRHAGYGKNPGDERRPHELAARSRFIETVAYQGIYTPFVEQKLTPTYALFDMVGMHGSYFLFPRLKPLQPAVDHLADITERQKLRNMVLFTAATIAVGYTLPQRREVIDLHAKEQIDNTTRQHIGFFAYYTFRTSLLLERAGYQKHPPESLAWRAVFGLGLAKELIFDAMVGTGPSVLDAFANGIGTWLGYSGAKLHRRLKTSHGRVVVLPAPAGIGIACSF